MGMERPTGTTPGPRAGFGMGSSKGRGIRSILCEDVMLAASFWDFCRELGKRPAAGGATGKHESGEDVEVGASRVLASRSPHGALFGSPAPWLQLNSSNCSLKTTLSCHSPLSHGNKTRTHPNTPNSAKGAFLTQNQRNSSWSNQLSSPHLQHHFHAFSTSCV